MNAQVRPTDEMSSNQFICLLLDQKLTTIFFVKPGYFGDAVLSTDQINGIVHDIVQSNNLTDDIEYSKGKYIDQIVNHPFSKQFLSGQGTTRYGTK